MSSSWTVVRLCEPTETYGAFLVEANIAFCRVYRKTDLTGGQDVAKVTNITTPAQVLYHAYLWHGGTAVNAPLYAAVLCGLQG